MQTIYIENVPNPNLQACYNNKHERLRLSRCRKCNLFFKDFLYPSECPHCKTNFWSK